jgi:hypothetical protein
VGGAARAHAADGAHPQPRHADPRGRDRAGSNGAQLAVAQLGDGERLRKARVHPIAVLAALRTYASGRGVRGKHTWTPVAQVVDALDGAF